MTEPLNIDYYSDILCVWAWIDQRQMDELNHKMHDDIAFHYYYVDIFGDVSTKIANQWKDKGSHTGFAEHVRKSASVYENASINSKIWAEVRPATSANAHLVRKAIEIGYDNIKSTEMALMFRRAFEKAAGRGELVLKRFSRLRSPDRPRRVPGVDATMIAFRFFDGIAEKAGNGITGQFKGHGSGIGGAASGQRCTPGAGLYRRTVGQWPAGCSV